MKKSDFLIGTRRSPLALWQAEFVKSELERRFPDLRFSLKLIQTTGDKILDSPLSKIGDKGLFTREIERALLRNEIDLAVHSLKDLPTETPDGLFIAAITKREDARDVLISKTPSALLDLPRKARVATGSLRRRSQLLALRPDLQIQDIRGNLNTRFQKFFESDCDAMILAFAGVRRLKMDENISEIISLELVLPAVGQGALAVETRQDDPDAIELAQSINDRPTELATKAERRLLRSLEGGCQIPIGAFGAFEDGAFKLSAFIGSLDGRDAIRETLLKPRIESVRDAEEAGVELAERLRERGAENILNAIRNA
ncbi:MAG: hydroxymethylbilane synthase [Chloroherpetonaceae bacterium]|nr:hydroxymethylbilane synthase [Chloroherpetonaceae bacterium]MDW8438388.1 hydroxymethylbilane synthase [Chloroherpetonaceae bacterium]